MCHRLRHHTVSRLPRSRRRWKPVLAARIKGLNMPFFDLSGFSSLALLLVLLIYATHRLITSSHFRSSGRRLSVFFISCRFLESREPSGRKKRVEPHPIYCQTSPRSLMQMYKLPRLWMYLKFDHISYTRPLPPPPRTSHTIRKTYDAPSFPPLLMNSW